MNKWVIGSVLIAALGWWASTDETDAPASVESGPAQAVLAIKPRVNQSLVMAKLHSVRTALHMYNIESGEVPTGFEEVVNAGLLEWDDVRDPWGQPFAFRSEKKQSSIAFTEEYEIFVYSWGPDGIKDNADDIYI